MPLRCTRRRFLRTALPAAPALRLRAQAPGKRPNFLFLMADDQRFDALSCAGNRFLKTPNLDRIAEEGVRFAQAFVTNSLCSPSRATALTGLYSHTHGVTWNSGPHASLELRFPTFPKLLRQAGYFTALAGKWHIRSAPQGFDYWCILPGQGDYHDPVMLAGGTRVKLRGYVDDLICDQAIEVLRNRPKNRPFCLLCWFKAPHRPWTPPERYRQAFEGVTFPMPEMFHSDLTRRPAAIRNSDMRLEDLPDFAYLGVPADAPPAQRRRLNYQHLVRNYYRVMLALDENVGRLLDYLDREGLAGDTFVLYTSDNGFFLGEYGLFDKRMMYEPSIRIPMLVRYPAGFAGGRVDTEHMVLNTDICHTILDYAGIRMPEEARAHGQSWRPLLEGRRTPWRESWMYEYFEYPAITCTGKMRGLRTSRWKLIHYIQQPEEFELFDLERDPQERTNLASQPAYRTRLRLLQSELERLRLLLKDDRSDDGTPAAPCKFRLGS